MRGGNVPREGGGLQIIGAGDGVRVDLAPQIKVFVHDGAERAVVAGVDAGPRPVGHGAKLLHPRHHARIAGFEAPACVAVDLAAVAAGLDLVGQVQRGQA